MPGDEIFDSIRFRRDGVDFTQWPKLSCSDANQLELDASDLRLDGDRSVQFQGSGQIRTSGTLSIYTETPSATEKLVILTNGNVGIGNSAPTTKLEVSGIVKADTFQGGFSGDGSGLTNLPVKGSQWQDGAAGAIAYSGGRVGIGTLTPGTPLEVVSTQDSILRLRQNESGHPWSYIEWYNNSARLWWSGTTSSNTFAIGTDLGGGTVLSLTTGGNVGIGTTSPTAKLQVTGGETRLEQQGWQPITFRPGWGEKYPDTDYDYSPPSYFRDSLGIVHLRGIIAGPNEGKSVICKLPFGPPSREIYQATSSGNTVVRVDIESDGSVILMNTYNFWIALYGISFRD